MPPNCWYKLACAFRHLFKIAHVTVCPLRHRKRRRKSEPDSGVIQAHNLFAVEDYLVSFDFAVVVPSEDFRKISQNFSPAGVTSPFVARAIPTDVTSVVPVSGR